MPESERRNPKSLIPQARLRVSGLEFEQDGLERMLRAGVAPQGRAQQQLEDPLSVGPSSESGERCRVLPRGPGHGFTHQQRNRAFAKEAP